MDSEDRVSSKHGPRLDEQMAHEVQAQVQGNPSGARGEQWHQPEPAADGEPDPSGIPHGHYGTPTGDDRDPDLRDERATIGSYLPRGVFPADREALLKAARENRAPDDVLEQLNRLPTGQDFPDAQKLWEALDMSSGPRF